MALFYPTLLCMDHSIENFSCISEAFIMHCIVLYVYTAGYFRPFLRNKPSFHNLSIIYRIKPLPYNWAFLN